MIPTTAFCYWCGKQGDIENPKPGTAVPRKWKLLPFTVTSNLKPKQTRLQRFPDTRVPFCPNYGTAECQPSAMRKAKEVEYAAKVASSVKVDEKLVDDFAAFLSRTYPKDFKHIE